MIRFKPIHLKDLTDTECSEQVLLGHHSDKINRKITYKLMIHNDFQTLLYKVYDNKEVICCSYELSDAIYSYNNGDV